ncbi:hypothetical protein JCM11641_000224 [Rhodosporidiobolus odoratus]
MIWDGPRTQPSFWTPSLPFLERRLSANSRFIYAYRALRLTWVALTFPLHLWLVGLSLLPVSRFFLPTFLYPGKKQRWTPPQQLVYPLLRRIIWAVCDIGSPGALTPAEEHEVPGWAWALERFTVLVGGGASVKVEVLDFEMPKRAWEDGWVKGEVLDFRGRIQVEKVPVFWFESEEDEGSASGQGTERWEARGKDDRVVLYFVGGGFVTGNPAEGSRCFKLARETGLRVVGANFRKAVDATQAFPAALQDALTTYAYLVLTLGYRDIVLAGDSAGGGLAINLLQYLTLTVPTKDGKVPDLVLPTGLLLFSPWTDLTASSYEKATHSDFENDIICASMATNSIRSYLRYVHMPVTASFLKPIGGSLPSDSVYARKGSHPWFSPSLPFALPTLTAVAKAYFPPPPTQDGNIQLSHRPSQPLPSSSIPTRPLRFFITAGTAELFYPEVHALIENLRTASRAAAVEAGRPGTEPFEVEAMEAEGEVHAFPLVPEWVSPAAARTAGRVRRWLLEGIPNSHPHPFVPSSSSAAEPPPRIPSPVPVPENVLDSPPRHATSPAPLHRTPTRTQDDGVRQPSTGIAPNTLTSIRNFILSGYLNILLIAVPLSFASHFAGWGSTADFILSFIAIVPLASLLGDATEQCALKLGQTVGGLLNATFGNAVELIVGVLALKRGELRIVQTSLLGSILSNLLLVLGCSFLAGGIKFKEQTFQMTAAQASSSLMVLAVATLVIPAAYHANQIDGKGGLGVLEELGNKIDIGGLLKLSRGTAIVLLLCYASYLFFQLRSHAYLFEDPSEHEEEEARMNIYTATGALVVVTVITSFCADYLVGAIDEFAQNYSIPKAFIGLILLPIVGNAAEHVTSVWMAAKGKMELTIGVAVGSSIQIAVGLIPILVLVGWAINQDLTLFFQNFETIVLFVSVLLVDILVSDGRSNYLEGLMLIALYIVIALAFWVS